MNFNLAHENLIDFYLYKEIVEIKSYKKLEYRLTDYSHIRCHEKYIKCLYKD